MFNLKQNESLNCEENKRLHPFCTSMFTLEVSKTHKFKDLGLVLAN